jgi:hypothetical protein
MFKVTRVLPAAVVVVVAASAGLAPAAANPESGRCATPFIEFLTAEHPLAAPIDENGDGRFCALLLPGQNSGNFVAATLIDNKVQGS